MGRFLTAPCVSRSWLIVLLAMLGACDRDASTQTPATRPANNLPGFLARLTPVAATGDAPNQKKVIVCLFTRTDCPISNSYAPEVRRIHEKFSSQGVGFYLVYPDADESVPMIEKHLRDYSYPFAALRDPSHELVKLAGARITPEAGVFDSDGRLLYRGRIDDRYIDFGKARAAPTQKDLEQALEAILAGKPAPAAGGPAIGCFIADVK
ncbi:MAG TPA: redoxin domain-containing protein [Tepidisphaeraceae bacterium]|jgi:hypothetical protein|nr:redoxin domain-containing protein [Tepidisphaeraceae bacterium]